MTQHACKFTGYDNSAGTGAAVNEVEREFNGLGQLVKEDPAAERLDAGLRFLPGLA